MAFFKSEFPFEEIRAPDTGDYFTSIAEAVSYGHAENQIWSVVVTDNETDTGSTYTYGPPRHIVNLIGYIATRETHDDDTYYEEIIEGDES